MAARKRPKPIGAGMVPLFDVAAFAAPADPAGVEEKRTAAKVTAKVARPVDYWVRGVFRSHDGTEHTQTVRGVGMSDRLDADVARFVRHLTEEGWQFTKHRALLVELLGAGADDGIQISLSIGEE